MAGPHDHRACEIRYRDLLGRLADLVERIEHLEEVQREIVDLLRDFRDLGRAMAARIESHSRQIENRTVQRILTAPHDGRTLRHFRN